MRIIRTGDFEFSKEEEQAINRVVKSNRVTEHNETREFEKGWAKVIGTKYAVAVNSGTSALIAGLYALKHLAHDDKRKKVITSPVTYIATSNAIRVSGLEPLYGDIEKDTFALKPSGIEKILEEQNPKEFLGILPVHLMGYPCDMDEINRIAKKHNLFVFEDASQAHGSKYKGETLGSLGDLSSFSFYVAHNIQCGELGIVNTNNIKIKNLLRQIKSNGRLCYCDVCTRMEGKCPEIIKNTKRGGDEDFDPRFTHNILGFNFRANEFATALGNVKLKEIVEINDKRRENVGYLNNGLRKHSNILQLPKYCDDVSYLGYPMIIKKGKRSKIKQELEKKGIETRSLFGCIPTQQPSFLDLKKEYEGKLPNAEYVGKNGFYIGVHQFLKQDDLDYIIKSFDEVMNGKK